MPSVAHKLIRSAILLWVAACGSSGGEGPPPGEFDGGGGLGFVGSGGGGGSGDATSPDGEGSGREGGALGNDASVTTNEDAAPSDGSLGMITDGGSVDSGNSEDGAVRSDSSASFDGGDAEDGGSSVGVTFNVPGGFFPSLDWVIAGPAGHYSGTVLFGDAHSYEFVVGGIQSGDGYTLTLTGKDIYGDPCSGTSAPFPVYRGGVTAAGVVIDCVTADAQAAAVTTGSVGVDAAVVFTSH